MNPFSPDYSKRDYLLPDGCKDLIDLLKLQEKEKSKLPWQFPPVFGPMSVKGPVIGSLPGQPITVKALATFLHQKPFKIIADLMQLGVFATVDQAISFDSALKLLRRYGYWTGPGSATT